MTSATWTNVTKSNPCPLCDHTDWCSVSHDGGACLCNRTDTAPLGWRFVKKSSDDRNIFAKESESKKSYPRYPINKNTPSSKAATTKVNFDPTVLSLAKIEPIKPSKAKPVSLEELTHNAVKAPLNVPVLKTEYWYSDTQWIARFDWVDETKPKGRDKTFRQWHEHEGKEVRKKGDRPWGAYRFEEAIAAVLKIENPVLLVVEGEKCVEALNAIGIAAITLQGSNWGKDAEFVISQLALACPNLILLLLPDNDTEGDRKMGKLARLSHAANISFLTLKATDIYPDLPEKGDVVEAIAALGAEEFTSRIEAEINRGSGRMSENFTDEADDTEDKKKKDLSATQKGWELLVKLFGDRVRWNEMTLRVEIDGKAARELEHLYLDLEIDHNIQHLGKEKVYDMMIRLAKTKAYHPVKEYLERVAAEFDPINIDNLATRFFKTTNPIYDAMVKAHLIGSVKRIYEPGCKKDEALILQGKQGIGKSTFFSKLYGRRFFSDSLKGTDRDNLLILHQYWCLEMAELESITGRKEAGELKAFITSQEDTFRPPYGKVSEPHERQSVLVGTVNPQHFLHDDTGNRRFWVIPVRSRINVREVDEVKNSIWSAAVAAYRLGEASILTYEQEQEVNELNKVYIQDDAWEPLIDNYLVARTQTTSLEIFQNALMFENAKMDTRSARRIAGILRNLGWTQKVARYQGKLQRAWYKDQDENVTDIGCVTGSVTMCNPDSASCYRCYTKNPELSSEDFDNAENKNEISDRTEGKIDSPDNQNDSSGKVSEIAVTSVTTNQSESEQGLHIVTDPVTAKISVTDSVSDVDTENGLLPPEVLPLYVKHLTGITDWAELAEFLGGHPSEQRSQILKSVPSGEIHYLESLIPETIKLKGKQNRLMRAISASLPKPEKEEEVVSPLPVPVPDPELEKIFPFGCKIRDLDGDIEGEVFEHSPPYIGYKFFYKFANEDKPGGWIPYTVHKDKAVRVDI